jgi:glycosyltransferase involved in cell wall biosynthesis
MRQVSVGSEKLTVYMNSPKAKVQLHYGSPPGNFYPHQYKIQMTQWESTLAPSSHAELIKGYDELWTANDFGKTAYVNAGVPENKIHVFEHGIDSDVWVPKLRGKRNKIRFLHIDSGSPRKRADIVVEAFKSIFGDDENYELTLKWSHAEPSLVDWTNESVLETQGEWDGNVRYIHETLPLEHLVSLYHFHDVFVYPSEGEGFGLIPLQALSTGMPTISTDLWCSYADLFPETRIEATMGVSSIKENYDRPGLVVIPSLESTADKMKYVADNIEHLSEVFFLRSSMVKNRYQWKDKCQQIIDGLAARLGTDGMSSYFGYLK